MRYQVRLIDQNLPGLTRELALACTRAAEVLTPERSGSHLYRALYRAIRNVLRTNLQAYQFCGAAHACDAWLAPTELGTVEWKEQHPPDPERIHRYVAGPEAPPSVLVYGILREALRAAARELPKRKLKGLARLLRRAIEKILQGRVFQSDVCGEAPLCQVNEPYDPWDRRDPKNRVQRT